MKILKKAIVRLAHSDMKNHASFLKWSTLIIWACSLLAEVGTFAYNKNLPKKQKRFIIQQELAAGGISLGMMYLLADRFQKFGDWLVSSGRFLPKSLPQNLRSPDKIQKLLKEDKHFIEHELKGHPEWSQKLLRFQRGSSVVWGTLGTIVAFNVLSPLISNKIASKTDKLIEHKEANLSHFPNSLPNKVTKLDTLSSNEARLKPGNPQKKNTIGTLYPPVSPSFGRVFSY
jgi:hypothetical protein